MSSTNHENTMALIRDGEEDGDNGNGSDDSHCGHADGDRNGGLSRVHIYIHIYLYNICTTYVYTVYKYVFV